MHSQHHLCFLTSSAVAVAATTFSPSLPREVQNVCNTFGQNIGKLTYFPGNSTYTDLNEDYFSATSWLGPACIVAPTTSQEMSYAVNTLVDYETPFAIRGGGHMPISNAANINSSGVLLSSSGLNQLILAPDQSTIEIGTGNIWSNVYEYLAPYQLGVVGGRAGLVGVPGFILGGGISVFGNEYGWASANVVQFDCVLASGDIISATPSNNYSSLFWALRGGGNSFAIVTAVHLKTFSLPSVAVGEAVYGDVVTQFLDSIYNFAHYGSQDFKSGIEPRVQWIPAIGDPTYHAILFYNGDDASPKALTNFTEAMVPVNSTFKVRPSMYNWTQEADPDRQSLRGLRARFSVVAITADREALQVTHDTFLQMVEAQLADVTNLIASLAFIPITEGYLNASTQNGGDPMDVDISKAPYIFAEETFLWSDAADDATIEDFVSAYNANTTVQLDNLDGVLSPFLYLNYADETQPVYEGYPKENVQKMKEIRAQYDPNMVFTDLMSGGWKVEKAFSGEDEA